MRFNEIRGRLDCVVVLGDCWHVSVCQEQLVCSTACAVSHPRVVEVHLVVVQHWWANISCVDGMGLKRVYDIGR